MFHCSNLWCFQRAAYAHAVSMPSWRLVWSISREIYAILPSSVLIFWRNLKEVNNSSALKSDVSHQGWLLFSCTFASAGLCDVEISASAMRKSDNVRICMLWRIMDSSIIGNQAPDFSLCVFMSLFLIAAVSVIAPSLSTGIISEFHIQAALWAFKTTGGRKGRITHKHITFLICLHFPQSQTSHFLHVCSNTSV